MLKITNQNIWAPKNGQITTEFLHFIFCLSVMLTNTTDIHNVSEEYKNDETSEAQAAKQTETEEKQNKQLKPGATKET